MSKEKRYSLLVQERKACHACAPELRNGSAVDAGAFDSDRIGPYSRWQGNLRAQLLVVGQDFANVEGFVKYQGWPGEDVPTNLRLVELLGAAGIEIAPPRFGEPDDRVFFTNAVLCMKQTSGRSGAIASEHFRKCGKRFLRPTIDLVEPTVVVTLGLGALRAIYEAYDERTAPKALRSVVAAPVEFKDGAFVLMPLYHPSPRVLSTQRSWDEQKGDWAKVGQILGFRSHIRQPASRPFAA